MGAEGPIFLSVVLVLIAAWRRDKNIPKDSLRTIVSGLVLGLIAALASRTALRGPVTALSYLTLLSVAIATVPIISTGRTDRG